MYEYISAHIDSPRLDETNPLYEDGGLGLFDTHYYGGIKKYQWVTLPLAIHGVIIKKDGTKINLVIGEDEDDPVFGISDLLIHLAKDQMKKTLAKGVEGERLNILVGSIPLKDKKAKNRVKQNILKILNDRYGIVEEDFVSAESNSSAGKQDIMGLIKMTTYKMTGMCLYYLKP